MRLSTPSVMSPYWLEGWLGPPPVAAGADLLMPVFSSDEVRGVLRLAPKSTGREYDAEDLKFLTALAEQVATTADQFRMRHERQESEYARDIQQGLLPREIPQVPGFSIAGAWQPARTSPSSPGWPPAPPASP